MAAKSDLVAVRKKTARPAAGQSNGDHPAPGEFEQASKGLIFRPGDSAAAQQITWPKIAAVVAR